ncbi:hypothetical protein OUZ56_009517 [Daphnia magna]|uniref:Uncharacterized protein n=1 Tax=Daphnia magna TaxID=35525 RepID=A0ABR0AGC9_9CRUS|nr:hypothetical protein OUZ56_009517 [Daphnia magna]
MMLFSDDLATPMEVVPDENLSVEKQLPAMAKQPALVVVETIPTLPTVVKLTPMDDVHDPNTSNESELNITTEETVNENAEITSTAQSSSTTDESIWNFKPNFITYFTLVSQMELPDGWIWSFNQAKNAILCIYTDPLSNGTGKGCINYDCQMTSPFLQGWIQPFAWFGTKGGAPGVVLLELVTKSGSYGYGTLKSISCLIFSQSIREIGNNFWEKIREGELTCPWLHQYSITLVRACLTGTNMVTHVRSISEYKKGQKSVGNLQPKVVYPGVLLVTRPKECMPTCACNTPDHGYGLVYFQNVNEFEHIRRLDESVVLTVHKTKTAS